MYYDVKTSRQSADEAVRHVNRAAAIVQLMINGHPATIRTSQTEKAVETVTNLNYVANALKYLSKDILALLDEPAETESGDSPKVTPQPEATKGA